MSATPKDILSVVSSYLFGTGYKEHKVNLAALADLFEEQGMEDEARKLRRETLSVWWFPEGGQGDVRYDVRHGMSLEEATEPYRYSFFTHLEVEAFLNTKEADQPAACFCHWDEVVEHFSPYTVADQSGECNV